MTLAALNNTALAGLIRANHEDHAHNGEALAEAERRGIKLTVAIRRVTIHLRDGGHTDDGTREVEKHALDVAAGLEAL